MQVMRVPELKHASAHPRTDRAAKGPLA